MQKLPGLLKGYHVPGQFVKVTSNVRVANIFDITPFSTRARIGTQAPTVITTLRVAEAPKRNGQEASKTCSPCRFAEQCQCLLVKALITRYEKRSGFSEADFNCLDSIAFHIRKNPARLFHEQPSACEIKTS